MKFKMDLSSDKVNPHSKDSNRHYFVYPRFEWLTEKNVT
jgi:hypothetical protein